MTSNPQLDELLHKQPVGQRTFAIPMLVSQRLDDLCKVLNTEGTVGVIHRKDLIAALVASASSEIADLQKLVEDYRTMRVRDVVAGSVVELRSVKPGRRTYP